MSTATAEIILTFHGGDNTDGKFVKTYHVVHHSCGRCPAFIILLKHDAFLPEHVIIALRVEVAVYAVHLPMVQGFPPPWNMEIPEMLFLPCNCSNQVQREYAGK